MLLQGSYIHAKAWLAQYLLEQSWKHIQQGEQQSRPWPWADTWPVSRLIVPRLNIDQIILAGDDGRSLAFGPGHRLSSVMPGNPGHSMISAHRDTHFEFLRDIQKGDQIIIETANQSQHTYIVENLVILKTDKAFFPDAENTAYLHLVTCYPFDSIETGNPERYVVSAIKTNSILTQVTSNFNSVKYP